MRVTTRFQEVAIKGVYKWKDPATGRQRQSTKKFFQTVNPFNKNSKGEVKNRDEILLELTAERDAWLAAQRAQQPA